jgi:transposase
MVKTRSQTGNITVKKEEEEDCKPSLGLMNVHNTRSSGRISKRRPPVTNNGSLPAQQVKVEEDTDTKSLLKSSSKYSKRGKRQDISQEQISQLIDYIVTDNMSIRDASRKVYISITSGNNYYNAYKNDPEKKIPVPRNPFLHPQKHYTQKQIENLIKYITQDKMTVKEASAKADINFDSGRYYHNKYLEDPNRNIPIPQFHQTYTQDQREAFISYIINDKMSIKAASKKAKMTDSAAQRYYHKYFKQQYPDIASPSHIVTHKCYTKEQIKKVIRYIVDDKMSIAAASRKANVYAMSAGRHYRQYLIDNNMEIPVPRNTKRCTQDQINELIRYIVDDKMTIKAASKKASMCLDTGRKYYRQYRKAHHLDVPIKNVITEEQKSELIRYIVDDKMSINAASKKAKISHPTGSKHYHRYLNGQKRDARTKLPRVASACKNK